jgi:hypothetical protein
MDDDDIASRRCRADGRAIIDYPRCSDDSGGRLGDLGDVPLCRACYESAVIAGAFCGFAMEATATAIANMQALTRRHGPAPQAFVVVPIVGAFFIDLMNLAVLTFFLLPGLVVGSK